MDEARVRPLYFSLVAHSAFRTPHSALRIPQCCILALVVAAACGRSPSGVLQSTGSLRGANVLLVTIDTLRRDRVGAYGNASGLTPTIDRLAAAGKRFTHALTPAPLTLPAHASILTGLSPLRHGIHNNTRFRLDGRVPTLASLLGAGGYRTGAFVGAFVLDGRFGLSRGFDVYDDHLGRSDRASFHFAERRAEEVVRLAGDWILNQQSSINQQSAISNQQWFAWVHLFDPHAPYDAPPDYRAGRAPYDAEVAYADAMLGRFLARLNAAHALDRTLVVVTADHGESLGEHGETTHGLFAYDSTLAVPLILNARAIEPGIVEAPVSHVDVAPTILDLVGIAAPPQVDGVSLARAPRRDRPLYFEALDASLTRGWAPLRGVVQDGWKYIDLPDAELYDLASDPYEQRNRIGGDPHGSALQRVLQTMTATEDPAPRVALDANAAERLRSLGYAAGAAPHKTVTSADDPKRLVALNERFNSALAAFDEGRPDAALAGCLSILRERPDFAAARASASTVLVAAGKAADAVALLRDGLAIQPDNPDLLAKLGTALRAAGDLRGAATALEQARRAGDGNPDVMNDLAVVYAAQGRADAARATFHEIIERDGRAATTWFNLGLFELQMRRPPAAVAAFTRATEIDPSYGEAWQALGAALVDSDRARAIDAWKRAERLIPGDYDLLFNLGMLLGDSHTPAEAIPYLQRFVRDAPPDRYTRDIARVRATLDRLQRRAP
jgi:arylsulfatase A-like enzyme/tetratricopeptide (TPR) repeat protein